jgi:hypothetical protein
MKRTRYQQGTLRLEERASGSRVWEYRWYETQIDGKRRRRSAMIGSMQEFPSEAAAQKAVAALRANVNAETRARKLPRSAFRHWRITIVTRSCARAQERHSLRSARTKATWIAGFFRGGPRTV